MINNVNKCKNGGVNAKVPLAAKRLVAVMLCLAMAGTLLVFTPGSTDIADAQKVLAQLEKAKAHVIGAVLNNVEISGEQYYSDYYYSGDGHLQRHARGINRENQSNKSAGQATESIDEINNLSMSEEQEKV